MIAWQSKWLMNKPHKCQTSYFGKKKWINIAKYKTDSQIMWMRYYLTERRLFIPVFFL
jgi:hypothetical protein